VSGAVAAQSIDSFLKLAENNGFGVHEDCLAARPELGPLAVEN
jgi:hypothetical protein